MQLRQFVLAFVATVATVELVYLVYANLQLESAIRDVADSADLEVHYESAYSRYPGDAQLRGLRISSRGRETWSIYLERAELSLHPTLPLMRWSGILIIPSQMAHLELGSRLLSIQIRGDFRLRDLHAAQHGGRSDGGHVHLLSYEGRARGHALTMDVIVSEARVARGRPAFLNAEISGHGDDTNLLSSAWASYRASALADFSGDAWSMRAQLKIEPGLLELSSIDVITDDGSVRGCYRYDGQQQGRFLVVPRTSDKLGLELRDGELFPVRPSDANWWESAGSTRLLPHDHLACAGAYSRSSSPVQAIAVHSRHPLCRTPSP